MVARAYQKLASGILGFRDKTTRDLCIGIKLLAKTRERRVPSHVKKRNPRLCPLVNMAERTGIMSRSTHASIIIVPSQFSVPRDAIVDTDGGEVFGHKALFTKALDEAALWSSRRGERQSQVYTIAGFWDYMHCSPFR